MPNFVSFCKLSLNGTIDTNKIGSYRNSYAIVYVDLEVDDDSIESYLFTMRHIYRKKFMRFGEKSFHATRNVEFSCHHVPLKCLQYERENDCPFHYISKNQSYVMHYNRNGFVSNKCSFHDKRRCAIKDTIMWKYYEELNHNMKIALKNIFSTKIF